MSDFQRINLRIDSVLKEAAVAKAEAEDLTLSQVIRRFLREWVKDDPPEQEEATEPD